MKRRVWYLIAAALVIGSLVGGSTFALFTARSVLTSATFQAGTLKVALTDANGIALPGPFMNFANMAPGDQGGPYLAYVTNTGSLPLVFNFSVQLLGTTPAPADTALAGALLLKVERENADGSFADLGEHTIDEWNAAPVSDWQPALDTQAHAQLRFTATLPLSTGNSSQSGSISVALLVSATQPVVVGQNGVLTGTWTGTYQGYQSNPNRSDAAAIWPFTANVTQVGNTFTGTMVDLDDPNMGVTAISGTINGSQIAGTRDIWGGLPFSGTITPDGKVFIGSSNYGPINAAKQ